MTYLWLLIVIVLSVLMIFNPELLWKIEHIFTVKDGEPTELYLGLMRTGGVFLLLYSIGLLIYSLVK
ncbi:MAG: nickel ABC transporter permease [Clostridium sp.]|jgi:hypothetical protein|nr:nickel ABC transporter permease [Clostridium sp.]